MIYVVTGKLGGGKSLCAVTKIQDYLNQNRMVATNLDLYLEHLINPFSKNAKVFRVPDKPTADDLNALPCPYEGDYDEDKTGLLVLDELGTWFNSRTWNDKGRRDVIDWFLHSRKFGWDIIFIIQNVSMMDSQAREGLAEMVVNCIRLDRFALPFVGGFLRLFGINVRPPKFHVGFVKYGASPTSPVIERWAYSGRALYQSYNTRQVFVDGGCGLYQYLPPNIIYGRYTSNAEHTKRRFIQSINKLVENSRPRAAFLIGLLLSALVVGFWPSEPQAQQVAPVNQSQSTEVKTETASNASPLDGVRITGSVKGTRSFDYIFEADNGAFYPEDMGYRVRWITECRAALINGNETTYVTCAPYRAYETPRPREGDGVSTGEIAAIAADIGAKTVDSLLTP